METGEKHTTSKMLFILFHSLHHWGLFLCPDHSEEKLHFVCVLPVEEWHFGIENQVFVKITNYTKR